MKRSLALFAACCALSLTFSALGADPANEEGQLIAVLKSDQSPRDKDAACARLERIGTARSVPALAALLPDDQLSHSARYALESMPNPEAGQALLQALAKTSGSNQVGIINSLAMRHAAEAVPPLGKLLSQSDTMAAAAAARALGRIGGAEAIRLLQQAASASSGSVHGAEIDGLLACANTLLTAGDDASALPIFQRLYESEKSDNIRLAAFRGVILSSGERAVELMAGAIAGADVPSQGAALQLSPTIPGPAATKALGDLLPKVEPPVQIALLQSLGRRGDPAAISAVAPLMASPDAHVRLAAMNALDQIGDASVALPLARQAASAKGAEKAAARQSLTDLRGATVTATLLDGVAGAPPEVQVELIRALGDRSDASAAPKLLEWARGADEAIRAASLQALALVAAPADIPAFVQLVVSARTDDDRAEAAEALGSACQHIQSQNGGWEAPDIVTAVQNGPLAARLALLPVCGGLTAPGTRAALRAALKDPEARVQQTALHALCDTRDGELLPDLLQVACGSAEPKSRLLAIRGCVRLATAEENVKLSNAKKLDAFKMILATPLDTAEKRLVLSGLSAIPDERALLLATPMLDDDAVQSEAAQAVIRIAGSISRAHPAAAGAALKKVLAMPIDPATRESAETVLKKLP